MTPEEIEKLDGRELDHHIAEAVGREVVITTYTTLIGGRSTPGQMSDCPRFHDNPSAFYWLILRGVEEFGGITIGADMEEWAAGGLFQVRFFDYPTCWFAPMGTAVCRAFLLAFYAAKERG